MGMICGFANRAARAFFETGKCPAQWRQFSRVLARKLNSLDAAKVLKDLAAPGNHLEALGGDRKGQWSIRVNDRWRVCFRWTGRGPADVEIVDYHS
jgi:toxin HigB-1